MIVGLCTQCLGITSESVFWTHPPKHIPDVGFGTSVRVSVWLFSTNGLVVCPANVRGAREKFKGDDEPSQQPTQLTPQYRQFEALLLSQSKH